MAAHPTALRIEQGHISSSSMVSPLEWQVGAYFRLVCMMAPSNSTGSLRRDFVDLAIMKAVVCYCFDKFTDNAFVGQTEKYPLLCSRSAAGQLA